MRKLEEISAPFASAEGGLRFIILITPMNENEISRIVVNAIFHVHQQLGPGLLETTYERCLQHELNLRNLHAARQVELPLEYKGVRLDCGYRIDLLVEGKVIVEVKAIEGLANVHLAQILTYLKLSDRRLGLLVNFNVSMIKEGIRRVVNNL